MSSTEQFLISTKLLPQQIDELIEMTKRGEPNYRTAGFMMGCGISVEELEQVRNWIVDEIKRRTPPPPPPPAPIEILPELEPIPEPVVEPEPEEPRCISCKEDPAVCICEVKEVNDIPF